MRIVRVCCWYVRKQVRGSDADGTVSSQHTGAVFFWWTGKNSSSTRFDRESRQLARNWFMFWICVLDLVVSVVIVTFGAIVIEFWVLAIAPVNWMAVIGLGMLSYIPFVRSLFADEA